jgi:HAMP domain-containing protein
MNKIRNKLLLVLIIVTLVPTLLIGGYSLYSTSKVLRENVLASHVNKVSLIQERIENLLSSVESDVFFLRDSNALHLFLSSTESEGSRTQRLLLSNLRSSLKKFSEQKKIYKQVRFINTTGQEVVRINRAEDRSSNVSDTHLQNKSSRGYFTKTIELAKDKLFISSLDLNREKGEVVKPLQPTIRFATAIYDKENSLQGIVVLNVDANKLINIIKEEGKQGEQLLFVDQQGFYYYHPDESKAWGSEQDLGSGGNLFKEKAELVKHMKGAKKLDYIETENDILVYNPIAIQHKTHALGTLFSIESKDVLFKPLKDYLLIFLGIGLAALLLTLLLAVTLSNSITRPLVSLKDKVVKLSAGDMDTPIEVDSKDEVGDVAHSIELLRKSMKILMKRSR